MSTHNATVVTGALGRAVVDELARRSAASVGSARVPVSDDV